MKVTICGCGNAAQLMAALISQAGRDELWVYAPFQNEAQRLREALSREPDHALEVVGPGESESFRAPIELSRVTDDAAQAVRGAGLVLLPLPSFAVGPTLRAVGPHLRRGALVGVLPGQGGCQWTAARALGADFAAAGARGLVLFASDWLPYNVRVEEWGRRVRVYSYKRVGVGAIPMGRAGEAVRALAAAVPRTRAVAYPCMLATTLVNPNQRFHPMRFYSLANPAAPYRHNPLFYEEMDEAATRRMQAVSDEILALAAAIQREAPSVDLSAVVDVRLSLLRTYGDEVEDSSTLLSTFRTNRGYKGIASPMVRREDGVWEADWTSRYIVDDVPFGLCVLRGLAELVDVPTPAIDFIILWAQQHMKKSYLVDGKLCGKDVKDTGAPQAFGYKTLRSLPDVEA